MAAIASTTDPADVRAAFQELKDFLATLPHFTPGQAIPDGSAPVGVEGIAVVATVEQRSQINQLESDWFDQVAANWQAWYAQGYNSWDLQSEPGSNAVLGLKPRFVEKRRAERRKK